MEDETPDRVSPVSSISSSALAGLPIWRRYSRILESTGFISFCSVIGVR